MSTEAQAASPNSGEAAASAAAVETTAQAGTGVVAEAATPAETPAYTPTFKYKAMGKDYDIPEDYRSYIKSKEDEEKLSKVFSMSQGIEVYKQKYIDRDNELNDYKKSINALTNALNSGDYESFFQGVGLKEQQIYEWVQKKLQYMDLPPEQKRIYDEQQEYKRRSQMLGQQNQEYTSRMEKLEVQIKTQELQSALTQPDVQSFSQTYDNNHGPNAFWNKVVSLGAYYDRVHGVDKSAQELIQELMGEFKPFLQSAPQAPVQAQNTVQAPTKKPVIPKVGSGSSAPAAKAVKSIEDLKRLQKEMYE